MGTAGRMIAVALAMLSASVAAQEAGDGQTETREQMQARLQAAVEALLDAARAGDAARFRTLSEPAGGPQVRFSDYRSGRRVAIGFDEVAALVRGCRAAREEPEFFYTEPHSISVNYACDGGPGYGVTAFWDQDNRGIESLLFDERD